MRLDKEKIKESLDIEDIKKILYDLGGGESKKDREGNLMFITCCHGGNKHKLYYYEESKMFRCYTDCQENYDIFSLVSTTKKQQGYNYSFYDAVRYVADVTGKQHYDNNFGRFGRNENEKSNKIDDWKWIERFKRKDKISVELPVYDERILDVFLNIGYEPWEEEGISLETQRMFEIGYYVRNDSVIIPNRTIEGKLIGIRQRNTKQEELNEGRKYTPVMIENRLCNFPTMYNLYGLNITQDALRRIKKCIIFEDEKSVMKCQEYFGEDNFAVATYGSYLSDYQVQLLISQGIEEVFLARDKEYQDHNSVEANAYAKKLVTQAHKFSPYIRTYVLFDMWDILDYKDSPADKGKDSLLKLMKNKIEITTNH